MAETDTLDPNCGYKLESLIAEGTRGRVYLASDSSQPGKKVAIKFLLESEFPDNELAGKHISHEARCLTMAAHANVVKHITTGTNPQGRPYLVMDYVPGPTLKQLLSSEQDPQVMMNMFIQLTHVVENAHKVGILHNDLRPDKIFVQMDKKGATATLVGFGRASLLPWAGREPIVEPPGKSGLYSLQYISPDQAMDKRCLAPSDVYALGCIIYETLTGRPPFQGENELHMMAQHLNTPAPSISSIKGEKYKKYDEPVMQSLNKEAHRRFVDCAEFRESLQFTVPSNTGGWMSKLFKK